MSLRLFINQIRFYAGVFFKDYLMISDWMAAYAMFKPIPKSESFYDLCIP